MTEKALTTEGEQLDVPMSAESALIPYGESGLQMRTFADVTRACKALSQSGLFTKRVKGIDVPLTWQECFARVEYGRELGLPMMVSMHNIYDVYGKPHLQVETAWALVLKSGELEDSGEEWSGEGDDFGCTFWVKPKGRSKVTRRFTIGEAKKAQLYKADSAWMKWERRMLYQRPKGFCIKDAFPHLIKGLGVAAEDEIREINVTSRATVSPAERKPAPGPHPLLQRALEKGAQPAEIVLPKREREPIARNEHVGDAARYMQGPMVDVELECVEVESGSGVEEEPSVTAPAKQQQVTDTAVEAAGPEAQAGAHALPAYAEGALPDCPAGDQGSTATESAALAPAGLPFDPETQACPECGHTPQQLRAMGHGARAGEGCSLEAILPDMTKAPEKPPAPPPAPKLEPIPAGLQAAIKKHVTKLGLVPSAIRLATVELEARVRALRADGRTDAAIAQFIVGWKFQPPK